MNGDTGNFSDTTLRSTSFISRLKVELRQDKKKTTMLVILLIAAGIVGGKFVVSHSLPDNASAAGSDSAAERLLPDAGNQGAVARPGRPIGPQGGVGKSSNQTQQVDLASMDRAINRDLFWPNTKYFPSTDRADMHRATSQPDQAKQQAEAEQRERRKRLKHVESIRAQAEALCLTSTMLGRSPTALINEQVLRTGDAINGFRLKSIASDRCIVAREGVDVELQIRK